METAAYLHARPVLVRQAQNIDLLLVGCGGTGSYLAPRLADIAALLIAQGKTVTLTFIDPDTVDAAKNIPRQNFVVAEDGVPKATALALRYSHARTVPITSIVAPFDAAMLPQSRYGEAGLTMLIGCVDTAAARQTLHQTVEQHAANDRGYGRHLWYLDCGNAEWSGQVLLGWATRPDQMCDAFALPTACTALPAPAWQHPELLIPLPDEATPHALSCATLSAANRQGLITNGRIAIEAADMLAQLLLFGTLRRYATYVDLRAGTCWSRYTDPDTLAPYLPTDAEEDGEEDDTDDDSDPFDDDADADLFDDAEADDDDLFDTATNDTEETDDRRGR